jgi:hypothetical protein
MGLVNLTTTPGNHHRSRNHVHICFFFFKGNRCSAFPSILTTLQQRQQETRRRARFLSLLEKERDCSLLRLMNAGPWCRQSYQGFLSPAAGLTPGSGTGWYRRTKSDRVVGFGWYLITGVGRWYCIVNYQLISLNSNLIV